MSVLNKQFTMHGKTYQRFKAVVHSFYIKQSTSYLEVRIAHLREQRVMIETMYPGIYAHTNMYSRVIGQIMVIRNILWNRGVK